MADLNQVRRRADEFARLVDGDAPSPSPVQDPEFARAMDLVAAMREAGSVEPRADFSSALRRRLVDEAEARITATPRFPVRPDLPGEPDDGYHLDDDTELDTRLDTDFDTDFDTDVDADAEGDEDESDDDVNAPIPLHAARRGRLIAGAAAFVLLAGGVGSAAAAQQSMPGDALYGLKRGLESVASKVSVTDDSRGRRELSHALARLTEAEHLVATRAGTDDVNDTLGDFSTETRSGGEHLLASFRSDNDASAIEKIYVFAADAGPRLQTLGRQTAIRPAVAEAIRAVNGIVGQAVRTCPTCLSPKTMTTPSSTIGGTGTVDPNEPASTDTRPSSSTTDLATPAIPGQPPTKKPATPGPVDPSSRQSTGGNPTDPGSVLPSVTLPTLPSLPGTSRSSGVPSVSLPLPSISLPTLPLPTVSLPPLLDLLLRPTTAAKASGSQPRALVPQSTPSPTPTATSTTAAKTSTTDSSTTR